MGGQFAVSGLSGHLHSQENVKPWKLGHGWEDTRLPEGGGQGLNVQAPESTPWVWVSRLELVALLLQNSV